MADQVLQQLKKDLTEAQKELKVAEEARQKAEKEKQKAETAYDDAVVRKQQASDNLLNAQDNLQQAESDLRIAVRDAAKTVSDLLSEAANLESAWQAQKASFDAGKIDDFPEALGEDIDALSINVDGFSPDFGSYERAITTAKKAVSSAKSSMTKADNAYAKREAELQSASAALTQAIADEDAAQKKVDSAQAAIDGYTPGTTRSATLKTETFGPKLQINGANVGKYSGGQMSKEFIDEILSRRNNLPDEYIAGRELVLNNTDIDAGVKAFDEYIASFRKWPTSDQGVKILAMKNAQYLKMGVRTPQCQEAIKFRQKQPKSDSATLKRVLSAQDVSILEEGGFSYVSDWDEVNDIWKRSQVYDVTTRNGDNEELVTYTGGSYTEMNRTLWGFSDRKKYVDLTRKATEQILNFGVPFNRIVIRGVEDPVDAYLKQLPDGALFVSENFSSTSFGSGFSGYKMYIRVPAGMAGCAVNQISCVPSENEVLLPPFLTVKLIKHVRGGVICEAI